MKTETIGKILIGIGLVVMLYTMSMPISIYGSDVINIQLMSEKQNTLLFGGVIFISGIVLFAVYKMKQTREEEEGLHQATVARQKENYEKMASKGGAAINFFTDRFTAIKDMRGARIRACLFVGFLFAVPTAIFLDDLIWHLYRTEQISRNWVNSGIGWISLAWFVATVWLAFRQIPALRAIVQLYFATVVLYGVIAAGMMAVMMTRGEEAPPVALFYFLISMVVSVIYLVLTLKVRRKLVNLDELKT